MPTPSSSLATGVVGIARCAAAGSTRQALNLAFEVVLLEYFPNGCPVAPRFVGTSCLALRGELEPLKASLLSQMRSERRRRELYQCLKGLSRYFDDDCVPCDKVLEKEAVAKWVRGRSNAGRPLPPLKPTKWTEDPIGEVVRQVAWLVGPDWASRMRGYRGCATVPDQHGCLELTQGWGGTLAVAESEMDHPWRYLLRLGTAKDKGKIRVITMQSAKVKEVLDPVHRCLYDLISDSDYVVRGEYQKSHALRLVADLRRGEKFVSGDFSSATDLFNPEMTFAVVTELCKSPHLTEEERTCMLESFRPSNLRWCAKYASIPSKGISHPTTKIKDIHVGQMMGSKLSFPLLCLINMALWQIACKRRAARTGDYQKRAVLINGDDIAFCGDQQFFKEWREVVSHYGMVVNLEKTGFSGSFIELNSRSYDVRRKVMVRKPVLSALKPSKTPGCVLSALVEGMRGFRPAAFWHAVVKLRFAIVERGVRVVDLPRPLRKELLGRRWFRQAVNTTPEVVSTGFECAWGTISRVEAPDSGWMDVYERACDEALRVGVRFLRGLRREPYSSCLRLRPLTAYYKEGRSVERCRCGSDTCDTECPERELRHVRPPSFVRYRVGHRRWLWRWPVPVWELWRVHGLPLRRLRGAWELDHAHLVSQRLLYRSISIKPPPSLIELRDSVLGFFEQSRWIFGGRKPKERRGPLPFGRPEGGGAWCGQPVPLALTPKVPLPSLGARLGHLAGGIIEGYRAAVCSQTSPAEGGLR